MNECWTWGGYLDGNGYGRVRINGRLVRVHRHVWEISHGPIPEGMHVLHHCDNRACINPKHLFLGTQEDNNRDMVAKGRNVSLRGERSGSAKLTWEAVFSIRACWRNGESVRSIARRLGRHPGHIHAICRNKLWKDSDALTTALAMEGK